MSKEGTWEGAKGVVPVGHFAYILEHFGTFWDILEHSGAVSNCTFAYCERISTWDSNTQTLGLIELRLRS